MNIESCCVVSCDLPLDKNYWENQYKTDEIRWDLGKIAPPIKYYFDTIKNKNAAILIPGCGNSYEAEYLLNQGFTNITLIDIASNLVQSLKLKFVENKNISVVLGDFFDHKGHYDYIVEQTFFCALPPTMRQKYVWKMHQLLSNHGKLIGLLFDRTFDIGPPFGGNQLEYEQLFKDAFLLKIQKAENSVVARANTELFIEFEKNSLQKVYLYQFEGITCNGCMQSVSNKFIEINGVSNASMSSNFSEIIIVANSEIDIKILQKIISYDEKYFIKKHQ